MSINHVRADGIEYNGTVLPIKRASVSASSSGDNSAIAAVAGKRLVVISAALTAAGTVTLTPKSDVGGSAVALSGGTPMVANGQLNLAFSPVGHFETAAGMALNLSLSGAVAVTGFLTYIEVPE